MVTTSIPKAMYSEIQSLAVRHLLFQTTIITGTLAILFLLLFLVLPPLQQDISFMKYLGIIATMVISAHLVMYFYGSYSRAAQKSILKIRLNELEEYINQDSFERAKFLDESKKALEDALLVIANFRESYFSNIADNDAAKISDAVKIFFETIYELDHKYKKNTVWQKTSNKMLQAFIALSGKSNNPLFEGNNAPASIQEALINDALDEIKNFQEHEVWYQNHIQAKYDHAKELFEAL